MNSTWQVATGVEPDEKLLALLNELDDKPVSRLARHQAPCCSIAEAWFRATARAAIRRFGEKPRWITERWSWGPTVWPIAWCEAVGAEVLDCGALADLAGAAFEEAGREIVRVQLIEEASLDECEQWAARWAAAPAAPRWMWDGLVYHEAVGVLDGKNMRVSNPTRGLWQEEPSPRRAQARAVRFLPEAVRLPRGGLDWMAERIPVGCWNVVS